MSFEGLIRREREEGKEEGREEGSICQLIRMSMKKVRAGKSIPLISAELEEPQEWVSQIVELIKDNPADTSAEQLLEKYLAAKAAEKQPAEAVS